MPTKPKRKPGVMVVSGARRKKFPATNRGLQSALDWAAKPKPKRKARGIVVWVRWYSEDFYGVVGLRGAFMDLWRRQLAHRAGCPRLKPGEVKRVRVVIEEVK